MRKKARMSSWCVQRTIRAGSSEDPEDEPYFDCDTSPPRTNEGFYPGGARPRVSFKRRCLARPNRPIPHNLAWPSLQDEDIPMMGTTNNTREVIIQDRGRGRNRPSRNFRGGHCTGSRPQQSVPHNPLGESNWYRISIPYGPKYGKESILRILSNYLEPEEFIPITYNIIGNEANFYVDDQKTAIALLNCDRRIRMTDGFKLQIRVRPGFPQCEIDDKLKDRLKQAMVKRYVQETNALDLSKFHRDPDLVADYFCALFRPAILTTVLEIVAKHIPTLEALSFEGNKLYIIERLDVLSKKFPRLKILHLGDNKIREMNQLDVIKDLKLEDLKLIGNPICSNYKSRQNDYISDVRKRFPKLLRLDGSELPRPITFDVLEEAKLPPPRKMYAPDAKAQEIARQFFEQYFIIYDSENRQPLLGAYDENACFSMTITYSNKLSEYITKTRNLLRIGDTMRRSKSLKRGKVSVVSFISQLPQTKHFLDTLTMDISLGMQTMMVTITGCFEQLDNKEIRYFNRTFAIIQEGNRYCICNEQLHMSQPSNAQIEQLNSRQRQEVQPAPVAPLLVQRVPTAEAGVAKPVTTPEPSEEIKQQMILTLCQQTNMNLAWSLKCLQEVQWHYDNALAAFQDFYKRGQVPPEAFVK